MLKKMSLCLLLAAATVFAQETITYSYSGPPIPILTDATNTWSVASIPVDKVLTITNVTVKVNVSYSPVGDLNVYMYAPDQTRTKLLERNCGSQGTLANISFSDDTANPKYADFCPAEAGRGPFRGNEPLANFNGKPSAGLWRLAVQNNGSQKIGYINGWSVTFTGTTDVTLPTVAGVVNAASLKAGAIAPGGNILVYGTGLGPADPVFAPAGQTLTTNLGGTQVLIGGTPAPIKAAYTSAVSVIAPVILTPGTTVNIQVVYGGNSSSVATAPVQATTPGLYSTGNLGTSDPATWNIVKAVDKNFKVIDADNPAAEGQVIIVYASGLGATNPILGAAEVPPNSPLYPTLGSTNASIGGVAAPVKFSGLAPGFPGVYQLNIQVPTGLADGLQPILIWNGGGVSQDNLSISVKAQ
jgi:uncharacterized protein (TIGR03437 family)